MTSDKKRVTLFLDPSITKHAKAQAVVEDLTLTNLVEMALVHYLPQETLVKKPELKLPSNPKSK
jgi:hypothetical protein